MEWLGCLRLWVSLVRCWGWSWLFYTAGPKAPMLACWSQAWWWTVHLTSAQMMQQQLPIQLNSVWNVENTILFSGSGKKIYGTGAFSSIDGKQQWPYTSAGWDQMWKWEEQWIWFLHLHCRFIPAIGKVDVSTHNSYVYLPSRLLGDIYPVQGNISAQQKQSRKLWPDGHQ